MSRTSPQNSDHRKSRNVVREVLAFLMRHWRREAWCVAGIAVSMLVATGADLLLPVFSGRLVDAVASGAAHASTLRAAGYAIAAWRDWARCWRWRGISPSWASCGSPCA